jgi:hypothetical protein
LDALGIPLLSQTAVVLDYGSRRSYGLLFLKLV